MRAQPRHPRGSGPIRVALVSVTIALIALVAHGPARAEPFVLPADLQGGWTAADKQLHFAGSLAIAASIRVTGRDEGESIAGTVSLGIVKELYDATLKPSRPRGVSWKDLVADILGAAAGAYLITALEE